MNDINKIETDIARPLPSNAGKGRPLGSPNKITARVREAIAQLAESNLERLQEWLERGAKDDPLGAARVFIQLLEFNLPKIDRILYRDESRNPSQPNWRITPLTRHVVHAAGLSPAIRDDLPQFDIRPFSPSIEGAPHDFPGDVVLLLRSADKEERYGTSAFVRALWSVAPGTCIRIFMSPDELRAGNGRILVEKAE